MASGMVGPRSRGRFGARLTKGREGQRALLARLASRRFGPATGDHLNELLANVQDPTRLEEVGDLILDCGTGAELLGALNGKLGL